MGSKLTERALSLDTQWLILEFGYNQAVRYEHPDFEQRADYLTA
jgi:hypothetical protein